MAKHPDTCEVKVGAAWEEISVEDAIGGRSRVLFRCPECKGRLRAHRPSRDGIMRAHFEHFQAHKGCSRSGVHREGMPRARHPHAID